MGLNFFKTAFLLTLLTLLLIVFGTAVGGEQGMTFAFLFSLAMNLGAYWFSDKMVLSYYRAEPLTVGQAPEVYALLQEICTDANLPLPKLYLIPSAQPNAFATGRNPARAVVAITEGLLKNLGSEELKGVLAHEMGHVRNRDILIATIAASLAGALSMLASMARYAFMFGSSQPRGRHDRKEGGHPLGLLLSAILIPIAAALIQMSVSRGREYAADEWGGKICGNPLYLASALRKLEAASKTLQLRQAAEATAHLFIVNPLRPGGWSGLFSTHPPIEERIARLEELARGMGL
ncbi:MAG: zinc metalloprotease HtpX [Candidatus Omnitrophica bacterium]|nr:zinc metalloprotease HtpX [Candidatus Omnitrophota bacterium]